MGFSNFLFFPFAGFVLFCCIKSKDKFGTWLNHYALTNAFWVFSLGLSIFFNDYLRPVSDDVYMIFFIGLIVFNVTMFVSKIPKLPKTISIEEHSLLRRRILEIGILLIFLPIAYNNFLLMQAGVDLWEINHDFWDTHKNSSLYLQNVLQQNIGSPLMYVLMVTCFYTVYNYGGHKKLQNYLTLLIGTSFAIMYVLVSGGGRTIIMKIMFIYTLSTLAWYNLRNQNVIFKIKNSFLIVFVVLALFAIGWASLERGHTEELSEILGSRLTLFPALFESYYTTTDICEGYTFGYSMFETPISFLIYPLKILGITIDVRRISGIESERLFVPALGGETNAYVSAYLYYMRDFGKLGVIIGPFLVGLVYNWIWKMCRQNSFLLLFYFVGIGITCLDSTYPFKRGFVFILLFAYLYRKFVIRSHKQTQTIKK